MLSLLYTFQAKKLIEGNFILAGRGESATKDFLNFEQFALCPDASSPTKYEPCTAATNMEATIFYIPVDKVHDNNSYTAEEVKKFVKAEEVNVVFEIDERQSYFAIDTNADAMRGYDAKKLWVVEDGTDMNGYEILMQVIYWLTFLFVLAIFIYTLCYGCCGGKCACCNSIKSVFPVRNGQIA